MFIVEDKKEKAIWITEDPMNKKSGNWHFYDNDEDYAIDLQHFGLKYGKTFLTTINRIKKIYKERGESNES